MEISDGSDLPIFFIDDAGKVSNDPVLGVPCVRLQIMPVAQPGQDVAISENWFLIDTGADYVYIENKLVGALGLLPAAPPNQIVINGVVSATIHVGTLATISGDWVAKVPMVPKDFASIHPHLGGALGRQFLAQCRLLIDGPEKKYALTLFPPRLKVPDIAPLAEDRSA